MVVVGALTVVAVRRCRFCVQTMGSYQGEGRAVAATRTTAGQQTQYDWLANNRSTNPDADEALEWLMALE